MGAAGLCAIDEADIDFAGYSTDISYGQRLGNQILAVVMIALWCCANGLMIFGGMSFFKVLRVDLETEKKGLDWVEHGGSAYSYEMAYPDAEKNVEGMNAVPVQSTKTTSAQSEAQPKLEEVPSDADPE